MHCQYVMSIGGCGKDIFMSNYRIGDIIYFSPSSRGAAAEEVKIEKVGRTYLYFAGHPHKRMVIKTMKMYGVYQNDEMYIGRCFPSKETADQEERRIVAWNLLLRRLKEQLRYDIVPQGLTTETMAQITAQLGIK